MSNPVASVLSAIDQAGPTIKCGRHAPQPIKAETAYLNTAYIHHVGVQRETGYQVRYRYDNRKRCEGLEPPSVLIQISLQGRGWFAGPDGQRHDIPAGQAFICTIPSETSYGLDAGTAWAWIWARFAGDLAVSLAQAIIACRGPILPIPKGHRLCKNLCRLWLQEQWPDEARQLLHAVTLLTDLLPESTAAAETDPIRSAPGIIQEHCRDPDFDSRRLAEYLRLSRSHCSRRFSAVYGVSPSEAIVSERLQQAADLLQNSNLPVKELARRCGFPDASWFAACFRKSYGESPTAWRRSQGSM